MASAEYPGCVERGLGFRLRRKRAAAVKAVAVKNLSTQSTREPTDVVVHRKRKLRRRLVAHALSACSVHNRVNAFRPAREFGCAKNRLVELTSCASFGRAPAPTGIVVHRTGNFAVLAPRAARRLATGSKNHFAHRGKSRSLTGVFMGFRGPKAHSNRPGGLSHIEQIVIIFSLRIVQA
jgi:hypothetical protein